MIILSFEKCVSTDISWRRISEVPMKSRPQQFEARLRGKRPGLPWISRKQFRELILAEIFAWSDMHFHHSRISLQCCHSGAPAARRLRYDSVIPNRSKCFWVPSKPVWTVLCLIKGSGRALIPSYCSRSVCVSHYSRLPNTKLNSFAPE